MATVNGRYNIKIKLPDGSTGYTTISIPDSFPTMDAALASFKGRRGIQVLEVAPGNYPWEPQPSAEQQAYVKAANQVIASPGFGSPNQPLVEALMNLEPTLAPDSVKSPPPQDSPGYGYTPQPRDMLVTPDAGKAPGPAPFAELQTALSGPRPATAPNTTGQQFPVATLTNAQGQTMTLTLDGSGETSTRLNQLIQGGWSIQSTAQPEAPQPQPGSPQSAPAPNEPTTPTGSEGAPEYPIGIAVKMGDGTTKQFPIFGQSREQDEALNQALLSGQATIVDPLRGDLLPVKQFNGGWVVQSRTGEWQTLNRYSSGEWSPGQREAIEQGVSAGQLPAETPPLPPGAPPPQPQPAPGGPQPTPTPPPGTTPPPGSQPPPQPPATAAPLSDDLVKALRELMQEARNAGTRGEEALRGLSASYREYLGLARSAAEQTYNQRNELTNALLGRTGPSTPDAGYPVPLRGPDDDLVHSTNVGQVDAYIAKGYKPLRADGSEATVEPFQGGTLIDGRPINAVITGRITPEQAQALIAGGRQVPPDIVGPDSGPGGLEAALNTAYAGMNTSTGLSPEAMAALRRGAIEDPERAYQGQVEQLKTTLAGRGAYGGGALPGSAGDIVRGYAPLMQGRDSTRSNLLANTILADEQRRFETLGLNRQTAANAMSTGAGLTSSLASAYNPASLFGATEGALGGLGNTIQAGTNSQFQGINTAGGLANVWQESQPSSFRNTLLAALAGTGAKVGADNAGQIGQWILEGGKWIWKQVTGGGSSGGGSTVTGGSPTGQPGLYTTPPFNPGY